MSDELKNEAGGPPVAHPTDDDLVLHYYDEPGSDHGDVARHLVRCDTCRARFVMLQRVMAMTQASAPPQPRASFEDDVWQRLAPAVTPRSDRWTRGQSRMPRGALGAGAAAVAVGVLLWVAPRPGTPRVSTTDALVAQPIPDALLLLDLDGHLERASRLLIEVDSGPRPAGLMRARVRAEDLVTTNRVYRHAATNAGETAIAAVLDDLGRALVELSRAPADLTPSEETRLRNRLGPDALLFKLRVTSATIRQQSSVSRLGVSESETPS